MTVHMQRTTYSFVLNGKSAFVQLKISSNFRFTFRDGSTNAGERDEGSMKHVLCTFFGSHFCTNEMQPSPWLWLNILLFFLRV